MDLKRPNPIQRKGARTPPSALGRWSTLAHTTPVPTPPSGRGRGKARLGVGLRRHSLLLCSLVYEARREAGSGHSRHAREHLSGPPLPLHTCRCGITHTSMHASPGLSRGARTRPQCTARRPPPGRTSAARREAERFRGGEVGALQDGVQVEPSQDSSRRRGREERPWRVSSFTYLLTYSLTHLLEDGAHSAEGVAGAATRGARGASAPWAAGSRQTCRRERG